MSPRQLLLAISTAAVLLLLPREALAFRCGSRLVSEGDAAAAALALCGQPADVSRSTILRVPRIWRNGVTYRVPGDLIEIVVETWTYNFGPDRLLQRVRVEDGIIVEIRTLGYGYR
jgi:Protein of unknown function (DUF2845)